MKKEKEDIEVLVENKDNIFAAEYSVKMAIDALNSVRKGIENERNRAGILLGFVFLGFLQLLSSLNYLFFEVEIIILLLLCFILYFLVKSFVSKSMKDSVVGTDNFEQDWAGKRLSFLMEYHSVLIQNTEEQDRELENLSSNIKISTILLSIIIIILFIF